MLMLQNEMHRYDESQQVQHQSFSGSRNTAIGSVV
jgi:hypothetical protein